MGVKEIHRLGSPSGSLQFPKNSDEFFLSSRF